MSREVKLETSSRDCQFCEAHGSVHARLSEEKFKYEYGAKSYDVKAIIPSWHCSNCEMTYYDGYAEVIRHEAICDAVGLLTPKGIIELRQRHNLTQIQLAKLTGIGEASIKRWERGASLQSISLDNLLRILESDLGYSLLQSVVIQRNNLEHLQKDNPSKFKLPKFDSDYRAAANFKLVMT